MSFNPPLDLPVQRARHRDQVINTCIKQDLGVEGTEAPLKGCRTGRPCGNFENVRVRGLVEPLVDGGGEADQELPVGRPPVTNCIDLPERDRLANLLGRLRACDSLDDVPLALLAEPPCDTRPSVKLVVHYPQCWQMFMGNVSFRELVKSLTVQVAAIMVIVSELLESRLENWVQSITGVPWLVDVIQWILEPAVLVGLAVLWGVLVLIFWLERVSCSRRALSLDLREMRHAAPNGPRSTCWSAVYTATRRGKRCVRVEWENGVVLFVWLPAPGERDILADLMRELIRLHHRELPGLIGPETRVSMRRATWDRHLEVLEAMIHNIPPGMGFLTAPGLLLSALAWLQSQMVRLLVVERFSAAHPGRAPREYWHNKQYWACLFPQLSDGQRKSFTPVAKLFRRTFCLSEEESLALWCLQCLRNMLAHGALSPYQMSEEDGSPTMAYLPASGKNTPCRRCPGYPRTTDQGGVIVSFAPDRLRTYFKDLRTVGQAVDRAATDLDLKHEDLL